MPSVIVPEQPILFYEGPHYYLSNFSSFAIMQRRTLWMTVEHAYQASKFFPGHHASVVGEIERAMSAHDAKQIAKVNKEFVRPDWQEVKLEVMEKLLRLKFAQHSYIRRKLLETGTAPLIEDSPKDAFWGRGPDGKGQNQLGKLWMKIREEEQVKLQQANG